MNKREFSIRPAVAAILLSTSAVAGVAGGAALANNAASGTAELAAPGGAQIVRGGVHASLADMVESVGPSVVQIQVKPAEKITPASSPGMTDREEMLRRFFGQTPERAQPRGALGSGFIVDASGIVVTNNHVVADAETVTVQLSDGRELSGRVLGRDDKTDLAVVKIDGENFHTVAWGDSDATRVGDSVFAVGSPFGLGNSVTSGIVSARGREIGAGPYDDFLQVDAAINSGNSGGPLFDAYGRVVGVNTAIVSPSGGNVGIGFAIPAQLAREVVTQIVEHGGVSRGRIGVALQTFTGQTAEAPGLAEEKGALISGVEPDGPAALSGIQPGDIVRRFGNKAIEDAGDFARAVADSKGGAIVPVEILRDGRRLNLRLRIGGNGQAQHS
ncbi:trypsin-like peptidase domain-containing protein [Sphingosinicella rhizophila]|uniref:Trypsin-like peptidase domain-containing protein n=1 Tax=Sphingosinicella rhizophila TaxID=3050082 RepID=A0ABU3Q9R2_9SPHN|nr:trypsin-like peptidase domain-containing protein [Sphingosinicella sp. GR2756]MDT9600146.1 trypsin-like peptidase domain-containing protein [Sphingosinicella sp. GR2756]